MKTLIKTFVIAIFLALTGTGIYLYILLQKAQEQKPASSIEQAAKESIETKAAIISKAVEKDGLEHTVSKMAKEIDNAALDKAKADLLDTVEKLNITRDQLKQVLAVNLSFSIRNQDLQKKLTTVATIYTHNDDHFKLAVNIPLDSSKSATFDAGYDADLMATQYYKKRWLFWKDPLIDIYSNDIRFTNKGLRTFTVKPKSPVIGFSIDAIANRNDINGNSAGAGARLRIGRVTLGGNYQFYPEYDRWALEYGLKYRLVGND